MGNSVAKEQGSGSRRDSRSSSTRPSRIRAYSTSSTLLGRDEDDVTLNTDTLDYLIPGVNATGLTPSTLRRISNLTPSSADAHAFIQSISHRRHSSSSSPSAIKRRKEKEREREVRKLALTVRVTESVDGGFLAPSGVYSGNLDFDIIFVRSLIIERRLAPFFKPLSDFDPDWTDKQLMTEYNKTDPKLLNITFDAEGAFASSIPNTPATNEYYKNVLSMYHDCTECPICFLLYPKYLNRSRCCFQSICTECFVQIKRLDPHPPHDADETPGSSGSENSDQLVSDFACCPFCAMPDFGVTYEPTPFRFGIPMPETLGPSSNSGSSGSEGRPSKAEIMRSLDDHGPAAASSTLTKRRGSIPSTHPAVITTDAIRPDWKIKLIMARTKLARKAATASAIHASSLLLSDGSSSRARGNSRSSGSSSGQTNDKTYADLEERMIMEAIKLSLLDEERRTLKRQINQNGKSQSAEVTPSSSISVSKSPDE